MAAAVEERAIGASGLAEPAAGGLQVRGARGRWGVGLAGEADVEEADVGGGQGRALPPLFVLDGYVEAELASDGSVDTT